MHSRHFLLLAFVLGLIIAPAGRPAHAQTRVGEAVVVKNEVVRVAASITQINVGDALLRDEVVRTGIDSAVRLVLADSTNLSLGPGASLKLDRTVFNDEHTYRDVAIRLTTGTFRFVTGHSEKAAYKITTPLATIGVRGTKFDFAVDKKTRQNIFSNPDGTLAGSPRVVRQEGITEANRPQAQRHAEQAVRAVRLAAPFNLPSEFYPAWKRIAEFRFDRRLSQ